MRVLQIISSVAVGLGGVLEGVRMLSEEWTSAGHLVEVVTLDSPGFPDALAFPVPVHTLGPSHTKWAYSSAFYPWLKQHHHEYDFIIIHGLWQYQSFAAWRALHGGSTPYVVFTHGMLDPYFRKRFPFKHLQKTMVWPWSDYLMLRDATAVMFTCDEERKLARNTFAPYVAREVVIGYGTRKSPVPLPIAKRAFLTQFPLLQSKRLLTFVGRLHPKKGCDILIEAFASSLAHDDSWHLVIAGPNLDGWEKELRSIGSKLKIEDRITWTGMLQHELKWGAIAASELLILPSHQENFGVVVAEALACGVPVVVSDQVNIWREIEASQAGLVTVDTVDGIKDALTRWNQLSSAQQQIMRDRTVECFEKNFDIHTLSSRLMKTFEAYHEVTDHLQSAVLHS
jgi:glycosyltransferase involved in cell wall biosynthesis